MSAVTYEFEIDPWGILLADLQVGRDGIVAIKRGVGLRFGDTPTGPQIIGGIQKRTITFASETDAVMFRLKYGDVFSNPRAVA